jgi:branched-chain amino acid transport system substrate-binding protein
MKTQKPLRVLTMLLIIMLMAAGCVSQTATPAATEAPAATQAPAGQPAATEPASADVPTVKIGFVWPLTGGSATIGQQHNDGALMAIDEINKNGGIKSLGGAKIEAVVYDSETSPDVGSSRVETLCTKDNVDVVVGCYNSAVTFPASEVAQRYATPFISMGGVKNEITERGYEWVFRVNNKASYDVAEMLKGVDLCLTTYPDVATQIQNDGGLTYALIYESTDWGSDNARIWKEEADKRGWKCVLDEPVTSGQSDMSAQVLKIKKANPDVINFSFYTNDAIVLSKALYANKVNPRLGVWSVGGGSQDAAFYTACAPGEYEYTFVQEDWNVSMPYLYDWAAEISEQCNARNGYYITSFFAQGWTAAKVAIAAIEAAGSTDKEAIKQALKNFDVKLEDCEESHIILTGYPEIKFDENGQNTFSSGTIIQYQQGIQIGFSPASAATPGYTPIIPIPDDFGTRGSDSRPWGTKPEVK